MVMAAGPTRIDEDAGEDEEHQREDAVSPRSWRPSLRPIWRRRIRIDSLCTRRAWAMLEPNLSAWIKTAARSADRPRRSAAPSSCRHVGPRAAHLQLEVRQGELGGQDAVGVLHFVAHLAHRLVQAQAGLDAHDHHVQGVGQGQEDRLLPACAPGTPKRCPAARSTGRSRPPTQISVFWLKPLAHSKVPPPRKNPANEHDELQAVEDRHQPFGCGSRRWPACSSACSRRPRSSARTTWSRPRSFPGPSTPCPAS